MTPMRSYEILEQASQSSRRTIANALAVLETEAAFGEDDTAQIRIGQLPLPSRETVGLVLVIFEMKAVSSLPIWDRLGNFAFRSRMGLQR